jgi:ATP-dependent RNA helicase SUPV3L1/SUV3
VKRDSIADEMRQLDQPSRAQLRKYGVRFGAFNIFLPPLLKPAAAELTLALWALNKGSAAGLSLDELPEPPRAGLTSVAINPAVPEEFYRAAGYHVCGPRAIRVDMLERLADSIRPLLAWRATEPGQTPPRGSSGDGGFMDTPQMMPTLGCSSAQLGAVLTTLGFRSETRPAPKPRPQVREAAASVAGATQGAASSETPAADAAGTPESETGAAGEVRLEPAGGEAGEEATSATEIAAESAASPEASISGPAEVAAQDAPHPFDVLDVDGPIQPHFLPHALDIFEPGFLAQHHDHRIAGDHPNQKKDHQRHADEDRDQRKDAAHDVLGHSLLRKQESSRRDQESDARS